MSSLSALDHVEVSSHSDHLEVRGVSSTDLQEALALLEEIRSLQAAATADKRHELVRALMSASSIPSVPRASVAQSQRSALMRDALLGTGVDTHESLMKIRGDAKESSTRTWVSRRLKDHRLIAVRHGGRKLIPSFQLQDNGEPRPELQALFAALVDVEPWTQWKWLTTGSNLLSGEVPERVARQNPARALMAAQRFAAPRRS